MKIEHTQARLWLIVALVLTAAFARFLPHPPNVAPIAAMALFAGARLQRTSLAFIIPLGALFLSDCALQWTTGMGFYTMMPAVYLSFIGITFLGVLIRNRQGVGPIAMASLGGSTLFFIVTNVAVWAMTPLYPKTLAGLSLCFTAAIPFFQNTLLGDFFFVGVIFGLFALAERRFSVFSAEAHTATI